MHIAEQQRDWGPDSTLSVADAIREAMNTSPRKPSTGSIESPQDIPAPEPHLPLRKASTHRLQARTSPAPQPLFTSSQQQQVRGFNPSPVSHTSPHIDSVTASSEHAFAGRAPHRPFKPPLGVIPDPIPVQSTERCSSASSRESRTPSSPLAPPPVPTFDLPREKHKSLKSTKSLGDGMRSLRHRASDRQINQSSEATPDSLVARPKTAVDEVRESLRSTKTNSSGFGNASSINTARSSLTGNSSHSELVRALPDEYQETEHTDVDLSVEDAISMYEDASEGRTELDEFRPALPVDIPRDGVNNASAESPPRPISQPQNRKPTGRPNMAHRRSHSASGLLGIIKDKRPSVNGSTEPSPMAPRNSVLTMPNTNDQSHSSSTVPSQKHEAVPRDRYGFKKASHYTTVAQYDAWEATYSTYIERRSKKWHALMASYGLSTNPPFRFPPKSDKIKRYVRKGIPPELRGAAWFWYAGGPSKLARQRGVYQKLLEKVEDGLLPDGDREHIERDLNRTFPDNVRFKPDPTTTLDAQAGAGGGDGTNNNIKKHRHRRTASEPETPTLKSLRRVLQAFAIHNPNIGYCQSLNFIAGLLLLFLNGNEEKAFVLLNIVTTEHLPGTHGIALEGANIDIAVLMSCIKELLPGVWQKLDDKNGGLGGGDDGAVDGGGALRLPTVSLATTAWFMSLFVGTLPIESVLRVWDCLFFEGSKTLFRIALAIFKFGEAQILQVSDPMEIFQVVQTIPRSMLDVNALMEVCFRRRGGFGGVSQGLIETRRDEKRKLVREGLSVTLTDEGAFRKLRGRFRSRTIKT